MSTPMEELKGTLIKMQDQFALSLPKHIHPDKFIKAAETAIMMKPELLQLDRPSLFVALNQAAQDGLLPDGREAAIIPYKGKAKYRPMVAGICKKARNSGEITTINAVVVYDKDEYEAWEDERGPHFKHKRAQGDRGKPITTFAYAIGKDGGVYFEEIDEEQMADIEKQSKATDSPWKGPFKGEMRRKSALRRLCKYRLPNSADLDFTFKQDDDFYEEEPKDVMPEKTTPTRLQDIVESQVAEPAMKESVQKAEEAFPEAKAAKTSPPIKQDANVLVLFEQGKIQDIKVRDGESEQGKWRRFSIKLNGKFYGTFDNKIGCQFAPALDAGFDVKICFTEKKNGDKIIRNIVSFEVLSNG